MITERTGRVFFLQFFNSNTNILQNTNPWRWYRRPWKGNKL